MAIPLSTCLTTLMACLLVGTVYANLYSKIVNETGVELPARCAQQFFFRGDGTQNYICSNNSNNSNSGTWVLVQPQAVLHHYQGALYSPIVVGFHFFTNPGTDGQPGSGAGWQLGRGCGFFNCLQPTDQFIGGAANKTAPQPNTIPWLLIPKKSSAGPNFANISFVQRLATIGGIPPSPDCTVGETYDAAYEADYIFSVCS